MTHTYAAYKRPTSEQKTTQKVKGWKNIIQVNGQENKARVAIVISDKTDFKTKTVKGDTEEDFKNTQGKNPSRRHKHYKHICTQHKSTQVYKENLGGLQERYR